MSTEEQEVKQSWLTSLLYGSWKSIFYVTIYYGAAVIYPIFRSSRIARGKESEQDKIRVLKFW